MPALTTARTTAFMPALSPPEVRTAIFIVEFVILSEQDPARLYILVGTGRKLWWGDDNG